MKIKFNFFQYVWIFIASCYAGYLVETLWCLIKYGFIESRKSLVLGHLSVAYGMGAVLLTFLLTYLQNCKNWQIFLISFLAGTVTEYICSLGQEIIFGTVAWDYSNVPLNINGRVCLLYSIFWGFLGLLWIKIVMPGMNNLFTKISIPHEHALIYAFVVFFVFDCTLSASAAIRMNRRDEGVPADTKISQFLDSHYPDEKMQKIYANSKQVDKTDK